MSRRVFSIIFVITILFPVFLYGIIPTRERNVLIALYNATNGDSWIDNSGWKTPPLDADGFAMPGTEDKWVGIWVSYGHVTDIYLSGNELKGNIPPELGNLSNMISLMLSDNQLRGSIPAVLGNLSNMSSLKLSNNQLSGSIPVELGNLRNLGDLYLFNNQLSGAIPAEIGNLRNLEYLYLYNNPLSGSIPPELGNLRNLRFLSLSNNQLSGSIPPELGNISNLEWIALYNNQLSGSIPPELGNISNLSYVLLYNNQLSGSIPAEIGNLHRLEYLKLYNNQLSGSIPAEIGNLRSLKGLYLYNNKLSGSIPPELGNIIFFGEGEINLSSNQLSGSIPPELGNIIDMISLDLSNNQLSGSIPPELGNIIDMISLYLSNNQLSGSIPAELGNLRNLLILGLSFNQLSGNIPLGMTYLTRLQELYIRNNCLYTNDPGLRNWLYSFDRDWESHQCLGEKDPPFGFFDTPVNGSTVCSSIPVTGWALDDKGVDSVKIYRQQGNDLVYIGDGVFVEGARPDVAEKFPDFLNNTRAGWGYMMLTNLLPNSGNGTFVIHAVASDINGNITTLGIKTIYVNNAHAVKPFGAIDTPAQGGTASGSSFINWGWVLTPQTNYIPTDGSTINVYVDGVKLGHPTYNIYRSDIATIFPGYANSNGAGGYFCLDTASYTNGVHTIQWTARDSSGNTDGIGSRYFSINNNGTSISSNQSCQKKNRPQSGIDNISKIADIPVDYSVPVRVKTGYNEYSEPQLVPADEKGINRIEIKEVERIQIHLTDSMSPHSFSGYLEVNNCLKPLPIGSTLDTQQGIFYWQPGPGFIGDFHFIFIEKEQQMNRSRKNIVVKIAPASE